MLLKIQYPGAWVILYQKFPVYTLIFFQLKTTVFYSENLHNYEVKDDF